jgi:2-polyprenyl-3-methyl-5-hydroxy-6-metoxy-1,4-benzoquinol methylase
MDAEQIREWFQRKRKPQLAGTRVMELYFTFHPRTVFLKTLPYAAEVVDVGAGDGSLSVFKRWPEPTRSDLNLHAYSLEKGRLFDDFSSYAIGDWDAQPPEFDGRSFDAIVCAHFIEHIADPNSFVAWAARKLRPGGRVYLEWPSPASLDLPPRGELEALGVPLMISRFDDDATHKALPRAEDIIAACRAQGFAIEGQGIVRLPMLEDELLAHFRRDEDGFPRQAAFWSHTGWSQYLLLRRGD